MPNWCNNMLNVSGDGQFFKTVTEELDFEKAVPVKDDTLEEAVEQWGTKWTPSDCSYWNHEGIHRFEFSTPWCPPDTFILNASKRFKDALFQLVYLEIGSDFCGIIECKNGEVIRNDHISSMVNAFPQDIYPLFYEEFEGISLTCEDVLKLM